MAGKADFTQDEWKALVQSPMMAGMALTLAEPSGLWGMLQEGMASGKALLEAGKTPGANALIADIASAFETSEGRGGARESIKSEFSGLAPAAMKARAIEALGRAGTLLDAKAPGDAQAVKAWLKQISERVANAASEGGFLGFGGVAVSESEKATLAEVDRALNLRA